MCVCTKKYISALQVEQTALIAVLSMPVAAAWAALELFAGSNWMAMIAGNDGSGTRSVLPYLPHTYFFPRNVQAASAADGREVSLLCAE
jgi:hypothetical protein